MAKKITEDVLPVINKKYFKNLARIYVTKDHDLEVIHFFLSIGATIISTHENKMNLVVIYVKKPEKKE